MWVSVERLLGHAGQEGLSADLEKCACWGSSGAASCLGDILDPSPHDHSPEPLHNLLACETGPLKAAATGDH